MNIFKILASGDGHIYEPSINSFLAYLLDPYASHGLGDRFLKQFLKFINHPLSKEKNFIHENFATNSEKFEVFVTPEFGVSYNGKERDIDIYIHVKQIQQDNNGTKNHIPDLVHFIIVENKIRNSSIKKTSNQTESPNQLVEEWLGFISYLKGQYDGVEVDKLKDNHSINFVFITPIQDEGAKNEFSKLEKECFNSSLEHQKAIHKVWRSEAKKTNDRNFSTPNDEPDSIVTLLKQLLVSESLGVTDPIYDYCKHTLKAFLNYVENDFRAYVKEKPETGRKLYKSFEQLKESPDIQLDKTILNRIEGLYEKIKSMFHFSSIQHSQTHLASFFLSDKTGKMKKIFSLSQPRNGSLEIIKNNSSEEVLKELQKKDIDYTESPVAFKIPLANVLDDDDIITLVEMQYNRFKSLNIG